MNKYTQYLESEQGEDKLMAELFEQVTKRDFEPAYGTAMKILAMREIKWELKKLDGDGK